MYNYMQGDEKMKINMKIEYTPEIGADETHIEIKANKPTIELNKIIENIQEMSKSTNTIVAEIDNNIYILNTDEINKFYSENQYTYCEYRDKNLRVRKRLCELEEILDKNYFIRISKSCIINIQQVECFDMKTLGNIIVKFKNKKIEYVSKRKISTVIKFLKERWS